MLGYSTEYKEMIVKRMLSDDAISVRELVAETGVSRSSLYKWRNQYGLNQSDASKWSGEMKWMRLSHGQNCYYSLNLIIRNQDNQVDKHRSKGFS